MTKKEILKELKERKWHSADEVDEYFDKALDSYRKEVIEEIEKQLPEGKVLEDTNGLPACEYFENQFGSGYSRGYDEGFNAYRNQIKQKLNKMKGWNENNI